MKSSRKGTRLNDAQYFKNPLPHTREKMTVMFLLENTSSDKTRYFIDNEDFSVNFNLRTKNQGRKINLMEKSIEMALVNHDDGGLYASNEELSKGFFREVFVETDENFQRISSESIIITKVERSDIEVAVDRTENEKEIDSIENHKFRREKMNDRRINRENKRHSSRWRNSWITQLIINLFSQIMGKSKKKDAMEEEEEEEAEIDVTTSRSYLVYRKEDNPIVEEKSREEIVSTFVRQIQRTRDKNLRVMLLQRELQARLPAENTFPSKLYDEKLDSPRLSSPLC